MTQKICPICDQPMTMSHFCTSCKSFVKKPLEKKGTYYINERHPDRETECTYHSLPKEKEAVKQVPVKTQPTQAVMPPAAKPQPGQAAKPPIAQSQRQLQTSSVENKDSSNPKGDEKVKEPTVFTIIKWFVFIFAMIKFFAPFL